MSTLILLLLLLQQDSTQGQQQPKDQKPVVEESIVVSGIRADDEKPVTKTNITRDDIQRDYTTQDIPLLLRDAPSINTYTESGIGGSGYSYITLRGVSPTRLNFTLDGVPLADSEDMAAYFADFPDLARSLQSIQIQRGVGTSTVGSPSFGGSINLESIALAPKEETDVDVAGGSFGQKYGSVAWQSGITPGGYAMYTRISDLENDGYREHSGVHQRDVFFSGMKQNKDSQLRLTGFSGHERQHMSFDATDLETLKIDRRNNPLGPDDNDSFGYDLANLQYLKTLSTSTNLSAQAYYQRGYGWYSLTGDRYALDGRLLGTLLTMSWSRGALSASYGLGANTFKRVHTLDERYGEADGVRDYDNYGTKSEENAFAKASYDRARWHYYGDAQLRTADFHYHGDVAIAPIRWTFFNPKLGARYDLTSRSSVYGSAGVSTREPARNDLFQGEDNATFAHDLHAVRPERLYDFEAGWNFTAPRTTIAFDAYAMEFRHEIAATGQLSDIGLPLRVNVDRSYRRGLELDAKFDASARVKLRTNANVSRNRIRTWVQSYDVYDDAGNFVESRLLTHHDVNPLLTPPVIVNQSVDYLATRRLTLGATGRYVAKSYLDNTNNPDFVAPSFFVVDGKAEFALPTAKGTLARVTLQVNNLTNRKTYYPSGYSYLTMTPAGVIGGTSYFYPQATRNFVIMLSARP